MFNKGDRPIPGYRLERFLGRGQFGEVWAAEGPGGTLVALKFIALQQKTGIRELKSIQAVKRIKHANLCSVNAMWLLGYEGTVLDDHEIDLLIRNQAKDKEAASQTLAIEQTQTLNNPQYLVVSMTLAEGSLDQRQKSYHEGGIPRDLLMDYMLQAARGIDFLNAPIHDVGGAKVGIQHRDIKPANLLYAGDSVLVGDFGVAAAFGEYDTEATSVVGSLCYMSPESIKRIPSASSDQYALAITYYQLRTGTLPFEPTVSFAELVEIHVRGKLQFPLVSDHERAVLAKATSTDPKQRYATCVEFAKALAPPDETIASPSKSAAYFPAMIGGAVAAVVLVGVLVWGILGGGFSGTSKANSGRQLVPHTLVFSPEQTTYNIRIVPLQPQPREKLTWSGTSAADLQLLPSDKVHISAQPADSLYQPLEQELTYQELVRADWKITLEPIPAEAVLQQVTGLAAQGNWDQASQLFTQAAQLHPSLVDQPTAESIELGGTPAVVSHPLDQPRLAIAISHDVASQLGIVSFDQQARLMGPLAIDSLPYQVHLPHSKPWAVLMLDSAAAVVPLDGSGKSYTIDLGKSDDPLYRQVTASAMSPSGNAILVGQDHQRVTLLTIGEGEQPIAKSAEASFPTRVASVAFSPNGQFGFAMGIDGDGCRWPIDGLSDASAKPFQVEDLDEEVLALHPLSESRLLAITETKLLDIALSDSQPVASAKQLADLRSTLAVSRLTADQKFLVFSTQGQSQPLSIVDVETGEVTTIRPPDIPGHVEDFDISPDGRWVVYADAEGAIFALDLTRQPLAPLPLLPSPGKRVKYVRIAHDGQHVATLTEDGTIRWWNLPQLLIPALARTN